MKEKVLAARQSGITTIVLPERNRSDLRDIPESTRGELTFEFVNDIKQAVELVLLPKTRGKTANGAPKKGARPIRKTRAATPMEQNADTNDPAIEQH